MDDVKAGRFISLILRHHPEEGGVTLDSHGYADVSRLIDGVAKKFHGFNMDDLERIVRENNKQRYSFNEDKTKIRANQGHSVSGIDLELKPVSPPDLLYHGTAEASVPIIMEEGLKPMSRQYVHLSAEYETAVNVGKRHGKPQVLTIDTKAMERDGFSFFISENGVWLTAHVPPKYIERN